MVVEVGVGVRVGPPGVIVGVGVKVGPPGVEVGGRGVGVGVVVLTHSQSTQVFPEEQEGASQSSPVQHCCPVPKSVQIQVIAQIQHSYRHVHSPVQFAVYGLQKGSPGVGVGGWGVGVGVGGFGVAVGGFGVAVGGCGVEVGGTGVEVGGYWAREQLTPKRKTREERTEKTRKLENLTFGLIFISFSLFSALSHL